MESLVGLIHKVKKSNLPTTLPAYYYGVPNGKIYIIYARFCEVKFNDSDLEFVLAVLKDFKFDWENNIIISKVQDDSIPVTVKSLDQPDQKIKIVKT